VRAVPKTARVSASQRFAARPRGTNPVVLLVGGIAACTLIAVCLILFAPHEVDSDTLDTRVAEGERQAAVHENAGRYLEAAAVYDRLGTEFGASERYRARASGWRARAKFNREAEGDLKRLNADYAAWKAAAERVQKDLVRGVWEKGLELKRRAEKAPVVWKPELDRLLADLENRMKPGSEAWQRARERISKECRLDERGKPEWSKALSLWQAYLAGSVGAADRSGAESELRSIQARVREDFATLKARMGQLHEAGRADEARVFLETQRARFKGTASEADLELLIRG
jgi:hypothetical protein